MGIGNFYISTSSGTSKNEAMPIIYTKKDTQVEHMGLNTSGFSGKNLSYIFVNEFSKVGASSLKIIACTSNLKGTEASPNSLTLSFGSSLLVIPILYTS